MSVNVTSAGVVKRLDLELEAPSPIDERDVAEPGRLARMLLDIVRDLRKLTGLWRPRRIDFEGRALLDDGTTLYRFEHRFASNVRWWAVDWTSDDGGVDIVKDAASDTNTLVLRSYCTGTITLRVEEAG